MGFSGKFPASNALAAIWFCSLLVGGPALAEVRDLGFIGDVGALTADAAAGDTQLADSALPPQSEAADKAASLPESSTWMMILLWFAGVSLALGWRSRKPGVSLFE